MSTTDLEIPGSTSSVKSPVGFGTPDDVDAKLIIIMVGLPARGKSYIVKKLARYLNWLQHKTSVFNVGERRRKAGSLLGDVGDNVSDAAFFDPSNAGSVSFRDQLASKTLQELLDWLMENDGGSIGILDATNSTLQRRQLLLAHIRQQINDDTEILFLESSCSDKSLLETNIKLKLAGPDYVGKDPEASLADFKRRVAHYEKSYVPLGRTEEDQRLPYVQMIDVGRKVNTHLIRGYIQSHVVEYLLNFNLATRQIWVSCNGESIDDSVGRIGRESNLTNRGQQYARSLATFLDTQRRGWEMKQSSDATNVGGSEQAMSSQFLVWTSTMPQANQTAMSFSNKGYTIKQMRMLNDLNAGSMAGFTFEEIAAGYPEEYSARKRDKLLYRWPGLGGEGYVDLIHRLRSVIIELERLTSHVLLITHRAVVRVLLAYFLDLRRDDLADLVVLKESVFCFETKPYGIDVKCFQYQPSVDGFKAIQYGFTPFVPNHEVHKSPPLS